MKLKHEKAVDERMTSDLQDEFAVQKDEMNVDRDRMNRMKHRRVSEMYVAHNQALG